MDFAKLNIFSFPVAKIQDAYAFISRVDRYHNIVVCNFQKDLFNDKIPSEVIAEEAANKISNFSYASRDTVEEMFVVGIPPRYNQHNALVQSRNSFPSESDVEKGIYKVTKFIRGEVHLNRNLLEIFLNHEHKNLK